LSAISRPSGVVGTTPRELAATDGDIRAKAPREKTVVVRPRPMKRHVERVKRRLGKAIVYRAPEIEWYFFSRSWDERAFLFDTHAVWFVDPELYIP
jgi:hypothetical protein